MIEDVSADGLPAQGVSYEQVAVRITPEFKALYDRSTEVWHAVRPRLLLPQHQFRTPWAPCHVAAPGHTAAPAQLAAAKHYTPGLACRCKYTSACCSACAPKRVQFSMM